MQKTQDTCFERPASFKFIYFSKFGSCDLNLVYGTLLGRQGANVLQDRTGWGAPHNGLRVARPMDLTFFVGGGLTSR
jgi:hypothetical protein